MTNYDLTDEEITYIFSVIMVDYKVLSSSKKQLVDNLVRKLFENRLINEV